MPLMGSLTLAGEGKKSEAGHAWAGWLHNPCYLGDVDASQQGTKIGVAQKWGGVPHNHNALVRGTKSEVA